MTTGIYKLTFNSGRTYIGKSINIESRWRQHAEDMHNGKSSRALQQEYNRYGFPNSEIVFVCHEDHLDIYEETMIYRLRPELNGTAGRDRLKAHPSWGAHLHDYDVDEIFQMSTLEHVAEIVKLRKLLEK